MKQVRRRVGHLIFILPETFVKNAVPPSRAVRYNRCIMSTLRIASLVPFATEIVCALGLRDSLVAVSHVCDYPPSVKELPAVTAQTAALAPHSETDEDGDPVVVPLSAGEMDAIVRSGVSLYTINTATLRELSPTVIFTQGLCDVCAVSHVATLEAVRELGDSVQIIDLSPTHIAGVLDAIRTVGAATGRDAEAAELVSEMIARFESVKLSAMDSPNRPRVLLLEWPEPLFCAGHWSPELLGFANAVAAPWDKPGAPSRVIAWNDVLRFDPEVIILAACGMDAERGAWESTTLTDLPGWFELPAVRTGDCYAVDGNAYFNRPGPRLADSAELLATILHPETIQTPVPPYSVSRFPPESLTSPPGD